MDSTIIVGILSLVGTLAGSYLVGDKTTAVIQERIKTLEEKVNKHNNLVERTYKLESEVRNAFVILDGMEDDIKELKEL